MTETSHEGEGAEDLDKDLENTEHDQEDLEDRETEQEQALGKAIDEAADAAETAADAAMTTSLVQDMVDRARTLPQNPLEAIARDTPNPRFDALVSTLGATLNSLSSTDVSAAHVEFLEKVLGVDVSTVAPDRQGREADNLLTAMILTVQGKAVPPSGDPVADRYLRTLVDTWKSVDDATFWHSLSSTWQDRPATAQEVKAHVLFLRAASDLTPPEEHPQTTLWQTKATKLAAVEKIIAAGGAAPDTNANPPGVIDVAAMYRQAANSRSMGKAVPREVAIELMRLALAQLADGARTRRPKTPTPVFRPGRKTVNERLVSEPEPTGISPEVKTRNGLRKAARDLLTATEHATGNEINPVRALSISSLAESCYRGRADLGEVFTNAVAEIGLAIARTPTASKGLGQRLTEVVKASGFADAATRWSQVNASDKPTPEAIKTALGDLTTAAKSVHEALGEEVSPGTELLHGLRGVLDAIGLEVGREAAELVGTGAQGASAPEPGTRLGGALAALDIASTQGRSRRAAILARDGAGGIGDYTAKSLSDYRDQKWATDLIAASAAWTAADGVDVATMLKGTSTLATALDNVRTALASAPPEQRYVGSQVIDALATAVNDRVSRLADTGGEVSSGDASTVEALLRNSLLTFQEPAKLATFWSKGKDTISGKLPSGLNLDLTTRIKAWEATMAGNPVDRDLASIRTFSVVQAIGDYRVRVESGKNSPQDKTILLGLLDTVLATLSDRLTALQAPDLMAGT